MQIKIYYQDFLLNTNCFDAGSLTIEPESAHLMAELNHAQIESILEGKELNRENVVNEVWKRMNLEPWNFSNEQDFRAIGHTSMSIGDYVVFDDEEVWVTAPIGYLRVSKTEIETVGSKE